MLQVLTTPETGFTSAPDVLSPRQSRLPSLVRIEKHRWVLFAIAALCLAIQISPRWYPTPDSVGYLSIARNLALHHCLANCGSNHLYLSVGYPLLISPLFWLQARPFVLISMLHFVLLLVFMAGVHNWARRHLPQAALWITVISVLNVSVWVAYRRTLSEIAFMTVLIWLVNVLNRLISEPADSRSGLRLLLGSALVALAGLIRPAGILFVPGFALLVWGAVRRGRLTVGRAVGTLIAIGAPALLLLGATICYDRATAAGAPTYTNQLLDPSMSLVGQLIEGLRLRIGEVGRVIVPGMHGAYDGPGRWLTVNMLVYAPLFVLLLRGWSRLARTQQDVFTLTFPLYLGLHVLWPYEQATRFFTPVLPFLLAALWKTLEGLGSRRWQLFASLSLAHLGVATGHWLIYDLPMARGAAYEWSELQSCTERMRTDLRPVVVSEVPAATWMLVQFDLDRPVAEEQDTVSPARDIGWILVGPGAKRRPERCPLAQHRRPVAGASLAPHV
jgi:hypothetical protein